MTNVLLSEKQALHVGESVEYRAYFFALYPIFLIAAVIRFLLPKRAKKTVYRTIFHDAANMAHSVIPWVFSGR
ncbi:MAG: hypothetical protein AAFY22_04230 [Pseudomonadota bacterium]